MDDVLPAYGHISRPRDVGPAPGTHAICTLSLAWARSRGVKDASLYDMAETYRRRDLTFFEWDRLPVDLVNGELSVVGTATQRSPTRRDAAWDGDHLALRTPVTANANLDSGRLVVHGGLPRSIVETLAGRPLSDLVDLGFRVDAVIGLVTERDGMMQIEVEPRWTMVRPA